MAPTLRDFASLLERFRAGQCRRRPLSTADVLGNWRRRDRRRTYFALYEKAGRAEQRRAAERARARR